MEQTPEIVVRGPSRDADHPIERAGVVEPAMRLVDNIEKFVFEKNRGSVTNKRLAPVMSGLKGNLRNHPKQPLHGFKLSNISPLPAETAVSIH